MMNVFDEHGFYHPDRGYWQTTNMPSDSILATYPDGTVEVPLCPSPKHKWTGSEWVEEPLTEAEIEAKLLAWRDAATLTRRQFCLACLQAGLLTPDDAVIAAKGDWPQNFEAALSGLSDIEIAKAKVEWAAISVIQRNAPLLIAVQNTVGVSDQQLDALFGWVD